MIKIVHLSDMHIASNEDENHIRLREKIIESVKTNGVDADAVVFTGDLVDRHDTKAFERGKDFLTRLMQSMGLPMDRLLIVPGNHDMKRNTTIKNMLDNCDLQNDEVCAESWECINSRMNEYCRFMQDLQGEEEQNNSYGYGVRMIEKNGKKIIFNRLNSAWTNKGNQDYRQLVIGRWQLEENCKVIKENKTENDIVITLMHHPLEWLVDEEREMLIDYMLNITLRRVLPQLSVSSCFWISQFHLEQPLTAPSIHCSLYHF